MQQARFRQADIARTPEVARPRALRDRAFNPRARGIVCLEQLGFLALASRLQHRVMRTITHLQEPRLGFRLRTLPAHRTGGTVVLGKLDLDARLAVVILTREPLDTCPPLWTDRAFV